MLRAERMERVRRHLRHRLVRAFTGTFGLQLLLIGVGFLTALVLTNRLGAASFGTYVLIMTWAQTLTVAGKLGSDLNAVKHCAAYAEQKDWAHLRGFLRWMWRSVTMVSLVLAALAAAGVGALQTSGYIPGGAAWWALPALVPLLALIQTNFGVLRGLRSVYLAQSADMLRQVSFLALVFALPLIGVPLDIADVMALSVGTAGLALLLGTYFVYRYRALHVGAAAPADNTALWWRDAGAMTLTSGINLVNQRLDVLLLGVLLGPAATGLYAVGKKGVELMTLVPTSANLVVGPHLAAAHARGDISGLAHLSVRASRATFLLMAVPGLVLVLAGEQFLTLFGPEFAAAHWVLGILVLGQIVAAALGMVGMVLTMSGHARDTAAAVLVALLLQGALTLSLVPWFAMVGAAIAGAVGAVTWKLVLGRAVRARLGIGVAIWHSTREHREEK